MREWTGEVMVVKGNEQRCRTIVGGLAWLCGPAFRLVRNAWSSFKTALRVLEGSLREIDCIKLLVYNLILSF